MSKKFDFKNGPHESMFQIKEHLQKQSRPPVVKVALEVITVKRSAGRVASRALSARRRRHVRTRATAKSLVLATARELGPTIMGKMPDY